MLNVVLYEPKIPPNTGNIMRTCLATNVKLHLIKPLGFSLTDKHLKRSGLDYIKNFKYYVYDNFQDFVKQNQGLYYFVTKYGSKRYSELNYSFLNEKIYFIFGSETKGLPQELIVNNYNKCIRIPINKKVRSLNLANAVAIIIYEVLRQCPNYNKEEINLINQDMF